MTQVSYKGLKFKPFIPADEIQQRIAEIAAEISREYEGKVPLLVCVLNGAFPFAADIFRNLTIDAEITFIRLKSYSGTSSTGAVKEITGLTEDIAGRDVIVIEDIIDTGRTMVKLLADLEAKNPASLKVATLLHKPEVCKADIHPDYIGFNIPPAFIIGYGLDIDGLARNLKDIWVVDND
ncbi:MAG: hypoxanthine phosphoribosyltransferase [Paramuribaculum sp.]|nr:hypoxanthine phosphoribosyltransferase [Paramuribaculum sp.]MDE7452302.1 hypoxanthine phosphoribosyltransferase [Paramuribaculum sp.]